MRYKSFGSLQVVMLTVQVNIFLFALHPFVSPETAFEMQNDCASGCIIRYYEVGKGNALGMLWVVIIGAVFQREAAYLIQKGHSVTRVYGKYQGQEGKETRLECCHRVLQLILVSKTNSLTDP